MSFEPVPTSWASMAQREPGGMEVLPGILPDAFPRVHFLPWSTGHPVATDRSR